MASQSTAKAYELVGEIEPQMQSEVTPQSRSDVDPPRAAAIEVHGLSSWYGAHKAIEDITFSIPQNRITAIIGPSGCGKSTFIRCLNRMNELIPGVRIEGSVMYRDQDLYAPGVDAVEVRRLIGMVFQKPNPFPKTIYKNVAFGPRINGFKGNMDELVEQSLRRAALWEEVKDKLNKSAFELSGGQQQRLCIARALAMQPDVLLMDEPASALDPIATYHIEDLMRELRKNYTIVIVTHNMQQAARISDFTAFLLSGEERTGRLIEFGPSDKIFSRPDDNRTAEYITGRFG
jgi:phosphate transport system ATP-binding protein